MSKKVFAIINGYGVPKNMDLDKSYHAYLTQVFNWLWEKYAKEKITLMPVGGLTDFWPPYKRTEAGEMAKWIKNQIQQTGVKWQIKPIATQLTALENILACKKMVTGGTLYYFCERTREHKMKILIKKILGLKTQVISIEFDCSPPRYQIPGRKELEKQDLAYSLLALKNPSWRKFLKLAAAEKIKILRKTPENIRRTEIDRITRKIRAEYYNKYQKHK